VEGLWLEETIPTQPYLTNLPWVGIGRAAPITDREIRRNLRPQRSYPLNALSERLATLTPEHKAALEWFETRRGDLIGWPEPLNGLFLVNRPKGIHKPKGWDYTLSVRQSLVGPYADRPPVGSVDDAWTYDYFQEGQDPAHRDDYATNRGLMACLKDDVPVAVLIQEQGRPNVRYRVRGLAKVVDWDNGHFKFQGYDSAGNLPGAINGAGDIEYGIAATAYGGVAETGPPINLEDARRRIETQIVVRQGGKAFRHKAMTSFKGRCAISGWNVAAVLEAAHIVPYRGDHTNLIDNALLLRSDLHTLFDRELLRIDPDTFRIHLEAELQNSPYGGFAGQEVHPAEGVAPETFRNRLRERDEALKAKLF
jgi:putative restriction endonuclease